eukprot:6467785-Amphidinium_carterae.1
MEQVQELVTRIQAMEAREAEGIAREQALQGQIQNITAQLTTTQQAGGAASVGGTLISHGRGHRGHESAWQA